MRFTLISSPRARHQLAHQQALAQGLRAHGVETSFSYAVASKTKYVACWGWRAGLALRNRGHEVLVIERGYLGNRFEWSSLAWNGLNGFGRFAESPKDGGERFKNNFAPLLPWRDGGEYVLIMGQVPGDASLRRRDLMPWYRLVAAEAAEKYGLPVHFRQHPESKRKGHSQIVSGAIKSVGNLDEALSGAALVITYNSNAAVDSVLAGVPAIAIDRGSMAWPVAGHSVGEKIIPDREIWAAEMAWKQWRLDEISSGAALTGLLKVANVRSN